MIWILVGITIPFLGTAIGAVMSLFCKKGEVASNKLLIGFAAGVMIAASIWSLILPSIELAAKRGGTEFLPAAIGFTVGMLLMIILDTVLPSEIVGSEKRQSKMLVFAVTVHNIPEGMAVGAVFAGFLAGGGEITLAAAVSLSIGMALQNIPEGAIVGMPLVTQIGSRKKAFFTGVISGAVEPVAAIITVALYSVVVAILPFLLSFAAGAMIYVTVKELVPDIKDGNLGVVGLTAGFVLMMILDLSL